MNLDLFLNAIYKTFLHSIWQGTVLAIFGGLILLFGRKFNSSFKYTSLTFLLFLFLVCSICTFLFELLSSSINTGYSLNNSLFNLNLEKSDGVINVIIDKAYVFYDLYLAHYDRIIVSIWFIVICAKIVIMYFNVNYIAKLYRTKRALINRKIEEILQVINNQLKLKEKVRLFESSILKTPVVVGYLKPIILLPVGLATSLTYDQIEAILAHEMAHIKRKDFLVNIIQSAIEIIFFFNLPVLWISSMIRNEREKCCDDIALKITGNKLEYVNTLVKCVEYESPVYGIGFAGEKNQLLDRVKRIVGFQKSSLKSFDKFFLSLCIVFAIIFSGFITAKKSDDVNINYFFSSFNDSLKSNYDKNRVNIDAIIQQLNKSKIISDPNNYSIKITNFALYVNGERQSKILHKQVLEDFVIESNKRLHYTKTVKSNFD